MPIFFDPVYLLFVAPAIILSMLAQLWIRSAYGAAQQQPAGMSGAAAARQILDQAGLHNVEIEQIGGVLSDHYDPSQKVLRLSPDVYHGRSLAAVGIAAHEAGHAIQDGVRYAPLVVRNLAVPLAGFGGNVGVLLLMLGVAMNQSWLIMVGICTFAFVVLFQIINLPVEFDASWRAKALLVKMGIVPRQAMGYVNSVLNAAALTYVAGTLQSVLTLAYYVMRMYSSGERDSDRQRW